MLAAAISLAACTQTTNDARVEVSTATPEEMAELVSASVYRSIDAESARFSFEITYAPAECMELPAFSVEGASRSDTGEGWLDVDGDGDPDVVSTQSELLMLAPPEWNAPTTWVSLDPDDATYLVLGASGHPEYGGLPVGPTGFGGDGSTLVPTLDEVFGNMDLPGAEVTLLGPGEVRGVSTTGYQMRVEPMAPTEQLGLPTEDLGDLDSLGLLGLPAYTIEVQVDEDGLVRRVHSVMDSVAPNPGETVPPVSFGTSSVDFRVEMWDLGEPLDLPAIASDDVSPFGELLAAAVVDLGTGFAAVTSCLGDEGAFGVDSESAEAFAQCSAQAIEGITVAEYATGGTEMTCMTEMMESLPMPDIDIGSDRQACLDALAMLSPEDATATIPPECSPLTGGG